MSLQSGLELYAYTTTSTLGASRSGPTAYGAALEQLQFTTVAPGGYGTLTCQLRVPNALDVPSELREFAYVALMDPNHPTSNTGAVWQGRWDEPGIALDNQQGDYLNLSAQGAGTCMQDDPSDASYASQTAQSIIATEMSNASAYLLLDQDTSQILPDNPSLVFSPSYNGKTLEEKIQELTPILGDYTFCTWDHPNHTDAAGFPTWQLYWHKRTFSGTSPTADYIGWLLDEASVDVRPSVEWSYNCVQVKYRDATTGLPSSVTVSDSRLAGSGAQNTAPFPRRKLLKDQSSDHLTGTEATAVAQALLNEYQNGGYKVSVVLEQVRDANGNLVPLHTIRADKNILLPELTLSNLGLPTTPTANQNLYYIAETSYSESSGQQPQLTLTLDTFSDTAAFQLARMQWRHEKQVRNSKHPHVIRASGEQETGNCGLGWGTTALTSDIYEVSVNYKTEMSAVPNSITLTANTSSNVFSVGTTNSQYTGFALRVTVQANGAGFWRGTYKTVGN